MIVWGTRYGPRSNTGGRYCAGTSGGPSISNINPSSVTGSNAYRTFTINGANFIAGARVQVGFHDNNYQWQYTTNTPTFVNSSQLTVQIRTGLTVDTWNVRIQNPDETVSNIGHFERDGAASARPRSF